MEVTLGGGALEWSDATSNYHAWRTDQQSLHEPPVARMLHAEVPLC